ncbi:MAG: SCO1664 family protein [Anaerolineae bacterium]
MSDRQDGATTVAPERALHLLSRGEIEVEGLIPWSSNATLLVTVHDDDLSALAVYKPQRGERPLWDFPQGTLGRREVAAYLVSETLGWGFVPPTVLRRGPHGLGSVQLFIHAQEGVHFFSIQDDEAYREDLERLAAFDAVTNNADRKAGHCLVDDEGRLWAIDNALSFHPEPKLRTVIWDFAGLRLPPAIRADLEKLSAALAGDAPLSQALKRLLSAKEVTALRRRLRILIDGGCFPEPGAGRVVPWPLI